MHILFIDRPNFQTRTRRMLIEESHTTEAAESLGELHLKFKKGLFDLVIIDHTIENGDACFKHIMDTDPAQNVLVVSDAVKCVIPSCEECAAQHAIRRLNNPTPIPNIMRMIKGFDLYDCDHYDVETGRISSESLAV